MTQYNFDNPTEEQQLSRAKWRTYCSLENLSSQSSNDVMNCTVCISKFACRELSDGGMCYTCQKFVYFNHSLSNNAQIVSDYIVEINAPVPQTHLMGAFNFYPLQALYELREKGIVFDFSPEWTHETLWLLVRDENTLNQSIHKRYTYPILWYYTKVCRYENGKIDNNMSYLKIFYYEEGGIICAHVRASYMMEQMIKDKVEYNDSELFKTAYKAYANHLLGINE